MAFIISIAPRAAKSSVANQTIPLCSLDSIRSSTAASAAAALISISLLTPHVAIAEQVPLIFDHDQSLTGANFENRTDLIGAIFSKSNCTRASFAGADLSNAQLDDANFQEANFEGATAVNALATKAKFLKANLRDVDFTNANLVSAQFDGADIAGADFTDSLMDRATTLKLCKKAAGVNSRTGIPTSESLMCPE